MTFGQNYTTVTLLQTSSKHNRGKTLCMQQKSSKVCKHNGIEKLFNRRAHTSATETAN